MLFAKLTVNVWSFERNSACEDSHRKTLLKYGHSHRKAKLSVIPREARAGSAFVTRGSRASGHTETSSASGCSVGGRGEEGSFPSTRMHDVAIWTRCSTANGESVLKDSFRILSRTFPAGM